MNRMKNRGISKMNHRQIVEDSRLKRFLQEKYGLLILALVEILFTAILVLFCDKLYITVNDVLDSNIPLYKIFKNIHAWTDRTTPLPFLGGLERNVLTAGYTINSLIYWLFDIKYAFWINYSVAIAFSGIGFYCLGVSIKKITKDNIDPNLFCLGGIIYIIIGEWPISIIGFSLIPWWFFLAVEIYRTHKAWLALFYVVLIYNISFPLIGCFLLFFTVLFYMIMIIKGKEYNSLIIMMGIILVSIILFNHDILLSMFSSSANSIKGLENSSSTVYIDSLKKCLINAFNLFFIKNGSFYHSGLYPLKYIAAPIVYLFFLFFVLEKKRLNINKTFLNSYKIIVLFIFLSVLFAAFDKCAILRKIFPFLSGFSFYRFLWITPFFIILSYVLLLCFLKNKNYLIITSALIIILPISIMFDLDYKASSSMYNLFHVNFKTNILHKKIPLQVRFDDYFAPDLFEQIKKELNYNNEWAVAYGFDPGILQYNGIRTLDGYYSNYPLDYKEKWEKMILPTLKEHKAARDYWAESNGQRAYLYSCSWLFPSFHMNYKKLGGVELLIEPNVLRELNGKYIFSRVIIKNYKKLGLEFIDYWQDSRGIYDIGVYKLK